MPLPMWPCTLPLGKSLQEGEPKREHEKKKIEWDIRIFSPKKNK